MEAKYSHITKVSAITLNSTLRLEVERLENRIAHMRAALPADDQEDDPQTVHNACRMIMDYSHNLQLTLGGIGNLIQPLTNLAYNMGKDE